MGNKDKLPVSRTVSGGEFEGSAAARLVEEVEGGDGEDGEERKACRK